RYGNIKVGWSDHSVSPAVINRAVHKWDADVIEFHIDLDEQGAEYKAGHCWLPYQMAPLIQQAKDKYVIDGISEKHVSISEQSDRDWRADPEDGLRPLNKIRKNF
ncbi:MAG: N-acetylneuraminate synthase family protein, partial [Bacteroidales bacterium]